MGTTRQKVSDFLSAERDFEGDVLEIPSELPSNRPRLTSLSPHITHKRHREDKNTSRGLSYAREAFRLFVPPREAPSEKSDIYSAHLKAHIPTSDHASRTFARISSQVGVSLVLHTCDIVLAGARTARIYCAISSQPLDSGVLFHRGLTIIADVTLSSKDDELVRTAPHSSLLSTPSHLLCLGHLCLHPSEVDHDPRCRANLYLPGRSPSYKAPSLL